MSTWDTFREDSLAERLTEAEAKLASIKSLCESASRQGAPYSVDCDAVLALIGDEA
jgi:hypothetical protein